MSPQHASVPLSSARCTSVNIKGEISLVEIFMESLEDTIGVVIVLMGPTGAGKSSFIEALNALSTSGPLGIAKDQLEPVTADVRAYQVHNVTSVWGLYHVPIYIIDTPGFADPRISELQVLESMKRWRDACSTAEKVRMLYFHPISDIRLASRKKRCMDVLKSFWGARNIPTVTLVTTMWDRLKPESRATAEGRFESLRDDYWTEWCQKGSRAIKFENTYESAIDILKHVAQMANRDISAHKTKGYGDVKRIDEMLTVEQLLRERIDSLQQRLQMIDDDLRTLADPETEEFRQILREDRKDVLDTLARFSSQLEKLHPSPLNRATRSLMLIKRWISSRAASDVL
ncbi:hypothetical protein CVT24_004594 [Panaeolus cyanescens]|uniref:G domain-containing protein n=1 Tax=Panaeolus cyanescens TaxID=181874 RepID=A0A409YBC3_9AGAR|nr:hypothetical protein CVT24_004594 [Panaeolus cyanescens]